MLQSLNAVFKKALKTHFLNQPFTMSNEVLHKHKGFYQSWNSFDYFTLKISVFLFSLCSSYSFKMGRSHLEKVDVTHLCVPVRIKGHLNQNLMTAPGLFSC